jgi:hypothetical protein
LYRAVKKRRNRTLLFIVFAAQPGEIMTIRHYHLIIALIFAHTSNAMNSHQATKFDCQNSNGITLKFYLPNDTITDYTFSYFYGESMWSAQEINNDNTTYTIETVRSSGVGSGAIPNPTAILQSLTFSLPTNRWVTKAQTNGYYFPVYTYYPAKLTLTLNMKHPKGTVTEQVECTGW